jgi:hypothetical protein
MPEQQVRKNHHIEEILPEEMECPRCGSRAIRVTTKRGIHYKCQNEKCRWDSNQIYDFNKQSRRKHIEKTMEYLKQKIPLLNFVENIPYSPDAFLTGQTREGNVNYDISVFFMGYKLNRLRVEINQNLSKKQFFDSKYCYVIGRPTIVEYLSKRKGIVAHYLVDEKTDKIGVSRMDMIVKHCKQEKDNFGNLQYFIPKEIRPLLVTFDISEIKDLLFKKWYKLFYKNIMIK